MNITLQDFRNMALKAMESNPAGNTVIQLNKGATGLSAHTWTRLGSRTADMKEANWNARKALVAAFRESGICLNALPKALAKKLKAADFEFDKNGNVTSRHPLTARRIIALTDALATLGTDREKENYVSLKNRTAGWQNVSELGRIVLAKELAVEGKDGPGELAQLKMQHATIALELMKDIKPATLKLKTFGSPEEKLADFMAQVGQRVGSKMNEITMETNCYLSRKNKAKAENAPLPEKPDCVKRHGEHEYGGQDGSTIVRAIALILLAENKDLKDLCGTIDKTALTHLMETLGDKVYEASSKTANLDLAYQSAREEYNAAEEKGKSADERKQLKAVLDKTERDFVQSGVDRDKISIQADLIGYVAKVLIDGKGHL